MEVSIFFFNLLAITNIKYDRKKFLPSKLVTLKNILIFFVLLLTVNYSVPNSYSEVTQNQD